MSQRSILPTAFLVALAAFGCNDETPTTSPVMASAGTGTAAPSGAAGESAPSRAGASGGAGTGGGSGSMPVPAGRMSVAGMAGSTAGAGGAGAGAAGAAGTGGAAGTPGPEAGSGGSAGAPAMPSEGPLFPANGAKDVCADASLRVRFSGAPSVASTGKIRVFDAENAQTPVATVDLATSMVNVMVGTVSLRQPRPVYVGSKEVVVRLPQGALSYGHTYYVTADAGAIKGPDGTSITISDPMAWRFTTRAAAPESKTEIRVAVDGTGEFCSVQAALDHVPSRSTTASVITIGRGTYFELIRASGKNKVTLRGEDRKQTVILGTNNDNLNAGTAARALISIEASTGFTVENLTIRNLTPQGGSQAEALRLQICDQCVVRRADILSLQDTLLWSGRIYANDCYIEGNVDFVWGTGAAFFDTCEIKTVGRSGYIVQARNEPGKFGYVFVDSKITAGSGIAGIWLGRIDSSVYPGSQVAYINCQMGSHINPAGWQVTGGGVGASLRFQEYQSTDASGSPLDVSRRLAGSQQLSAAEAMQLRNPANVLGGWTPPK